MIETLEAPVTAPLETVTPIKPSEALRLGRLEYPEHTPHTYRFASGACAVGAMAAGWGLGISAAEDHLEDIADDGNFPAEIEDIFDTAENDGRDGDAAVLAYLESRGL